MTRKPHEPNLSKGARSRLNPEDFRCNLLIEVSSKSATHIVALCEANGLQLPAAEEKLERWIIVQTSDYNLAVLIRNDKGATIKLLYDSTDYQNAYRDFADDPTPLNQPCKYLWYIITEVTFGYVDNARAQRYLEEETAHTGSSTDDAARQKALDTVVRATLKTWRVLVFTLTMKPLLRHLILRAED